MDSVLIQAFVYLVAAVVTVPLASRLGLGSVLGYLIAGVVIGPLAGLVGSETSQVQHFAEFGVVMMLFLVGLELEPRALWTMRHRLLGLGGLQVALTIATIAAASVLLGLAWQMAIVIGMILSLSSTAIVLQTLNEKGLMNTEGGQASFSVLLFQDIAVIPMLALIPLLALTGVTGLIAVQTADVATSGHGSALDLMAGLAGWQSTLITIAAVLSIVVGGHYMVRPVFRFIAASGLREMFTAAALLLVTGTALMMQMVGLSPALGTFLAGVVLETSEYRHELESDIEPFKGLLLGLFFITVGAGIDFSVLVDNLALVLSLTASVMVVKALVLYMLGWVFGLKGSDRWLMCLGLAQAGEFGFVIIAYCLQANALPPEYASIMLLVVALSMLLTPLLMILFSKFLQFRWDDANTRKADDVSETGVAIIAGHGRFGQVVNRMLLSNGYKTVVLDRHADLVETMRAFDVKTFYGDATRPDLLHAAGLPIAKLLVVAIDDQDKALALIAHARRERPDIHIIARAYDRRHVFKLYQSGTNDIVRETFDSALRAGRYALQALGMPQSEAQTASIIYTNVDPKGVRQLAEVYRADIPVSENPEYIRKAKDIQTEMNQVMSGEKPMDSRYVKEQWNPTIGSERPSD